MGALVIGRVGLDAAFTGPVSAVAERGRDGVRTVTFKGWLKSTTLALVKELRGELAAQTGRMVAVTFADDSDFDGFYVHRSADIRAEAKDVPYTNFVFPFTVTLERLGGEGEVEFQSLVTGTVITNSHGLIASETEPFHAPPVNHLAYNPAGTSPTQRQRTTPDGAIDWYDTIDNTEDPSWSVAPADYYKGAVEISVSTVLRLGFAAPNDPHVFELSNGLVRIKPDGGGTSDGRILVAFFDGSDWDAEFSFKTVFDPAGTNATISAWHYMSILRNDPSTGSIRLVRDSAPTTNPNRHTLDITLRRGSRFATFRHRYSRGTTPTWDIIRDTNDAAAAFTPTAASGAAGVLDSVATNGFKYFVATPHAHSARTTEGGVRITSQDAFTYAIGGEIAGAGTGDLADDLFLQFFGWVSERDRAIRR